MAAPTGIRKSAQPPTYVGAASGRVSVPYPTGLKMEPWGTRASASRRGLGAKPPFLIGLPGQCVALSERYGSLTVSERSRKAFFF